MNPFKDIMGKPALNVGSTLAITRFSHRNRVLRLNELAGSVATLPKSTGSGARYRFFVGVLATSNSHIVKVGNTTDIMQGIISCLDSNLATVNQFGFAAAADSDTITLDRTNTGSVTIGEWLEITDVTTGIWLVRGQLSGLAPATPFSAAV